MEVRFTIRGEPKGKGRPRFCRNTGHAITPKDTVNYETLVRTEYSAAYPEFKFPDGNDAGYADHGVLFHTEVCIKKEKGIHAGK